ncbi:hypothetical protein DV737_g1674, partial [Chaetothyriales sp. CBS 132003]
MAYYNQGYQPAGQPNAAQNLQFFSSSYPAVSGHTTPSQAGYGGYGTASPAHAYPGYGLSSAVSGFGAAQGVSGRMGDQGGGLRTGWLAAFGTEGYEGEPSLMEELGVNFDHIKTKTVAVLNPWTRPSPHIMDDSDLYGGLLFLVLYGTFLALSGKFFYGYIYGIALFGSVALHCIFAMMSPTDADQQDQMAQAQRDHQGHPGGHFSSTLTYSRSASVLGYCFLPLTLTALFGVALPMDTPLGYLLTAAAVGWCTYSSSGMFVSVARMSGMRGLVAYPLALFYSGFGIMGIFSSRGSGTLQGKVLHGDWRSETGTTDPSLLLTDGKPKSSAAFHPALAKMEMFGMTGERLGTIGAVEKSREDEAEAALPQWQREFLSKPSVSIRQGIAWRYEPPYEDTDTIVLTAPSSRFVDIRLPKTPDPSKPLVGHPAFWAITGTSSYVFPGTEATPMVHVAHGQWKHDIDSKGPAITDEGDMFVLENGDVAEVGFMTNPHTGHEDMYKEYWTSRSPIDAQPASLRPCLVAEVVPTGSAADDTTRGLAIYLGNHFQALLSSASDTPHRPAVLAVERWTCQGPDSHWARDSRSGNANVVSPSQQHDWTLEQMLCPWLTQQGRQKGDELGTAFSPSMEIKMGSFEVEDALSKLTTEEKIGTGIAATWDTDLVQQSGRLQGQEAIAKGASVILGPTVNMQRSPTGGRGFESFSEDPCLSGSMAAATINGIQSTGVSATIKHFVCNDSEHERMAVNAVVSERALREIYLLPFQIALRDAGPWCLMTAYNRVNGTHASENPKLLKDILRGEWGFKGLVMSDWYGTYSTSESIKAGLDLEMPGSSYIRGQLVGQALRCRKLLDSDIDGCARRVLELVKRVAPLGIPEDAEEKMRNTPETAALLRKISAHGIEKTTAVIGPNAAISAYCGGGSAALVPYYTVSPLQGIRGYDKTVKYALGAPGWKSLPLMSRRTKSQDGKQGLTMKIFLDPPDKPARRQVDEIYISSSDCMLADYKNDRLPKDNVWWAEFRGTFTPDESAEYEFSAAVAGIAKVFVNGRLVVDNETKQRPGQSFFGSGTAEEIGTMQLEAGKTYDILVTFGTMPLMKLISAGSTVFGSGGIRLGLEKRINLQTELDRAVKLAQEVDQVLLCIGLNSEWESEGWDRAGMDLPPGTDDLVRAVCAANPNTAIVVQSGTPVSMPWVEAAPAILQAWYGGNETGNAIADVVYGKVNPSGKLPLSFPHRNEDNPAFLNFRSERGQSIYGEGVYIGYRFYEKTKKEVVFPFGYGLSYTTFSVADTSLTDGPGDEVIVTASVSNTGDVDGAEVVQIYVSQQKPSINRPVKELKGFKKVFVKAGAQERVRITISKKFACSFWDEDTSSWIMEQDGFDVLLGTSSASVQKLGEIKVAQTKWWSGLPGESHKIGPRSTSTSRDSSQHRATSIPNPLHQRNHNDGLSRRLSIDKANTLRAAEEDDTATTSLTFNDTGWESDQGMDGQHTAVFRADWTERLVGGAGGGGHRLAPSLDALSDGEDAYGDDSFHDVARETPSRTGGAIAASTKKVPMPMPMPTKPATRRRVDFFLDNDRSPIDQEAEKLRHEAQARPRQAANAQSSLARHADHRQEARYPAPEPGSLAPPSKVAASSDDGPADSDHQPRHAFTLAAGSKRAHEEIDYDADELAGKSYSDLDAVPFLTDPRAPIPPPPATGPARSLGGQLDKLSQLATADQVRLFQSLDEAENEQTGAWFAAWFGQSVKQVQQQRLQRRKIALKYELEARKRQGAVEVKMAECEAQLAEMRQGGSKLVEGRSAEKLGMTPRRETTFR